MQVFLSYAREDRARADAIRGALNAAGFDCVLDTESLAHAQEFNTRISQAVARAGLFRPGTPPGLSAVAHRASTRRRRLLLADGRRESYDAVGRSASNVSSGEIGWAFVKGGMLLDFERGPR
jgi:hypothetical protein